MPLASRATPTPIRPATDAAPAARIAARVREELRGNQIDPARDPDRAEGLTRAEVRRYNDTALARGDEPIDDEDACVSAVLASVSGYGPLQPYLDDPSVEEMRAL